MTNRFKRSVFELASRATSFDTKGTMVLSLAPRSGTRWLLEFPSSATRRKALQEVEFKAPVREGVGSPHAYTGEYLLFVSSLLNSYSSGVEPDYDRLMQSQCNETMPITHA